MSIIIFFAYPELLKQNFKIQINVDYHSKNLQTFLKFKLTLAIIQ